jgi:hypothetical protein
VAFRAEGFAGADLQALCTAAVMAAVRRSAPLLLEQAEREAEVAAAAPSSPQGQQQFEAQKEEEQQLRRQQLLDGIEVQANDWKEALAAAPPPCSRRNGMAALAAEAAAPLQQHVLPLLAQPLARVLAALEAADLPLPPPAAAAASVAAAAAVSSEQQQGAQAALAAVLLQHGALLPPANGHVSAAVASAPAPAIPREQPVELGERGDEEQQLERLGRTYPPCRLLLWGEGEQGQEAAAGAVLKLLEGE